MDSRSSSTLARRLLLAGAAFLAVAALVIVITFLDPRGAEGPETSDANRIRLTDVTAEAGISFIHEAGARGEFLNPETFGSGGGWFDHDGDGRPDLLLVNGNLLRGEPDPNVVAALYRNLGDGRFEDVTERAGLAVPLYGMGFAAADVDNDSDQDVFLYGLHRSLFFLNDGNGRFREVTEAAGLASVTNWVCAAAFFDYDRDGVLDLYVGNYVDWSPEKEESVDCTFGTGLKKYCAVAVFGTTAPQLFRGRGDGTFEERTREAGLGELNGKTLGITIEDYDRDGHSDIFVANDAVPNFLLRNRGDGTFEERGIESGFATDAAGAALAGMGIDTAWAPNDGPLVVAVGNFSGEPTTVHVQEGTHYFLERSLLCGVGVPTLDRVTFGVLFSDLDLDGTLDLVVANGHVFDVESITRVPYRQLQQVFLGRGWLDFEELEPSAGPEILRRPLLGRALAAADYDADGDLDLVLTENQGSAVLLRNDRDGPKRFIRVDLQGTRSNRDAIGAEVTVRSRWGGRPWSVRRTRKAVSSYLSQSERQILVALREGEALVELAVSWPSGLREVFDGVSEGQETLLVEGTGRAATGAIAGAQRTEDPQAANSVVLLQRGVKLLEEGRIADSLEKFEAAVARDANNFVAQRFRILALWRLRRLGEVGEAVREVAERFPSPGFLVSHFALVLRETGYQELAKRFYLEAVRLESRRADAWMALANIAFDRKEHDEALRLYWKVLELFPRSVEALANIGKVHTVRKEYELALEYLERALAVQPDAATALSTLGGVYLARGRYELAEEYLTRALESAAARSTRLEAFGNLGILYYKTRNRERAVECFKKVLELDPEDVQARRALERLRR